MLEHIGMIACMKRVAVAEHEIRPSEKEWLILRDLCVGE